jgi:DNA-binding response OmpR family regulator
LSYTEPGNPRLLLVEDERDIKYLLERSLTNSGFHVEAFLDPSEALANYEPKSYDGIILDIRMPKISGFELARKIWDIDPSARICFLTAYEHYREDAKWAVPGDKSLCFMVKPKSPSEVVEHLKSHGITPDSKSKDAKSHC